MLTKNCRTALRALNSKSNDKIRFNVRHIADISGLSYDEAWRVAEHLAQMGFLEVFQPESRVFAGKAGFELYALTERGVAYKTFLCAERREYFKEKWIDFLALIVAAAALIVSILK